MSRFVLPLLGAGLVAGCALPDPDPIPDPKRTAVDSLVPVLEARGSVRVIVGVREAAKVRIGHAKMHVKTFASMPFAVMRVNADELDELVADPDIVSIEPDVVAPPSLAESTTMIGAKSAWTAGYAGEGWAVAVLDTGVMKTHAHLAGKVISEACYSTTDTGTGSTSLCPGGVSSSTASGAGVNCTGIGGCDHGTHVAAITASSHTTHGGVAKSAGVVAIQVFSQFSSQTFCGSSTPCVLAYSSDWMEGLERVLALSQSGTKIAAVNLSLGGGMHTSACDATFPAMKTAIDNLAAAGIATVIAAGNDGYTNAIGFPGCISSAITVGATTKSDVLASYSNASSLVDVFAPGSSIAAAITSSTTAVGGKSGTSMAAPHVAGAFAVMRSARPSMTVAQGLAALQGTGVAITDTRANGTVTKPRIALATAISSMSTPPPCTRTAPTITVSQPAPVAAPQLVRYMARVTNRDAAACSAQKFDIAGSAPAGWTVTSASTTLVPGAFADVAIDVTPVAAATSGATVTFMATNAMMSAFAASATATYTIDCGRAAPDLDVEVSGVRAIVIRVANNDAATCGATSTYHLAMSTDLVLSQTTGLIVVDNESDRWGEIAIGENADGAYPVRVTLATDDGAIVATRDVTVTIGDSEGGVGLSDLDFNCSTSSPAGSASVLLVLALVLRRRRRR
ncbi:MAG: S8 family peptidase [Kofleriaceae bacterium]